MPIYEYQCGRCNHHFDRRQGFDDEPVSECPVCNSDSRRVLHSVPIIYKGSGFYTTDHRGGNGGGASGTVSEKTPEKTPEKTAEKKPDSAVASESVSGESTASKSD